MKRLSQQPSQAITRLVGIFVTVLFAVSIYSTPKVQAQGWPSRPVTIVAPFTAGTTSDLVARGLAQDLSRSLGQPVIVENRGGAGGNIGAAFVARADPDGYTLLLATTGPAATNKLMYQNMTFDPQRDFSPIVLIGKSPVIVVARPDAPFGTMQEFIGYAKSNPDKITAGFPGNGTLGHITGVLLERAAHIKFSYAQYRGSSDIIVDLMSSHIDIGMDSMSAYVPSIESKKIKALAIAAQSRWAGLSSVPTVSEAGLAGFEASVWYALLAPRGTSSEVVNKLNDATNKYLASDRGKDFLNNLGVAIAGGTPEQLRDFTASELAKWAPVIEAAHISF